MTKGPYLQALAPTSVEIRVELDAPAPVVVRVSDGSDGGVARVVRDTTPATMHVVQIDGLRPATHYTYGFGVGGAPSDGGSGGDFTTAPATGSRGPFSFVVYGDNRTDDASHAAIVRTMLRASADFAINTGDLVQDGASATNWQTFFDVEGPFLRSHNVFSCVGNHEISDGAGTNYLRYFGPTSDAHGEGEKPKLYGSFRWSNARFFLLDAMESFDSGPERAWLDDELARADAEPGVVWRIVVMHHGPWSAGPHGGNRRALRAGIPALFVAHKIDLILAGHDHLYERGFASGLRYLVSGGGGAPLYEIDQRLPSTRKVESVHHVVEVSVENDALRIVATRDDGSLVDRCGLTKGHEGWDCDPSAAPLLTSDSTAASPPAVKHGCSAGGVPRSEPLAPLALLRARRSRHARAPTRSPSTSSWLIGCARRRFSRVGCARPCPLR